MPLTSVKTPCVGICSTGIGDEVCRGCKRYSHEVIDWNAYTNAQKALVEGRLVGLLTQVIQNKITIDNVDLMTHQLHVQPVDIPKHRNIYCQAYTLLKAGASQITVPSEFGFRINTAFKDLALTQICEDIDTEFYALSLAHYERCFFKTV